MNEYTLHMMRAFQDELEKRAVNPRGLLRSAGSFLKGQAGAAGAGAGVGAAAGGLAGAGVQGYRGYQEAKERGEDAGKALLSGAAKGLSGAGTGAAIGAGLGGAAGLAGGARARQLAERAVRGGSNPLSLSARFGQRQLHSLTGYADKKALRGMRAGSYDARMRAAQSERNLNRLWRQGDVDPKVLQKASLEQQKAQRGLRAAQKAEDMGLTSMPGYLKSLAKNPHETMRTGAAEQWHGSGLGGKFMLAGAPVLGAAGEAMSPSEAGGPGRLERVGGSLAGGLAFGAAPIPLAGMSALATGAERLGSLVGAGGGTMLARRGQGAAR